MWFSCIEWAGALKVIWPGSGLDDIDGLVQDCSDPFANTLELLKSYIKPSLWSWDYIDGLVQDWCNSIVLEV